MARAAAIAALLLLLCAHARDGGVDAANTLSSLRGQRLAGADTLVSANGAFKVGFFTPAGGDQGKVYLGVMYAQAKEQTVMWVANRDAPVSAASSYSANVSASGELLVKEGDRVAWRSTSVTTSSGGNHTLTVTNEGNLRITDDATGFVSWQSFDHPADTFVPGMEIGLRQHNSNNNNGLSASSSFDRTLYTSWRSDGDPATGDFTMGIDPSAQLYIWRNGGNNSSSNSTYWRSGQWAGTNFVGIPWRALYVYGFKFNGDPPPSGGDMSYTFTTFNASLYRFVLRPNGTETCYMLLGSGDWEMVWSQPTIECHKYNKCGPNAECAAAADGGAICSCLKGFEPKSAAEYNNGNWSQGCVRSLPLTCSERNTTAGAVAAGGGGGDDGFTVIKGVKLPDFAVWGSIVSDLDSCRKACLANCSCGAYSFSIGSCLTWGQDLVDIYRFPNGGAYDLYVKVPPSLAEKLGIGGKKKPDLPLLLRPAREAKQDFSGPAQSEHEKSEEGKNCELPLLEFEVLAMATDNFSSSNKLGEGGFGCVFKGRLPEGEEIAVKRLSRSSGQGLEEFKNEVILIAKLQHRNLVRLLGCCIQGEEKILVYEYMPNKSLDAFLFDPEKRGLLDWRTRFQIIEGVARGLLYLHRDSRLRVVHRDLKASNILLDHDMNPKISDFGMARIFGGDQNQVNTNRVVGTLGYMSPEYAMEGLFSVRSDVYSFGILILEIITGQKNSSFHHMEGSLNIVGYAWQLWNGDKGEQLIDPAIRGTCSVKEALRCIHMALLCVQDHAHDRPDIPYVVLTLGSDSSVLPMPRPPTFTLQCTSSSSGTRDMYYDRGDKEESYSANDLTVTMLQGR
uniref:Receptor-like serine/threonine-protein kinase n=1 Tax=Leersia perrieri TaxID=77586 RepID=A0A0D9X056_9ORYZ